MLAAIRSFAKSWAAALLIGLLIVSFAIFGIRDVFQPHAANLVVQAGGREVSGVEFRREFDNWRRSAEQQAGQAITPEMAAQNGIDRRLLDEVALRASFGALLEKIGLRPSDKLLTSEIQKEAAFFDPVTGRFDRKLYASRLAEAGLTPAAFEAQARDDVAQGHLVTAIASGFRTPKAYSALVGLYAREARDVAYFPVDPKDVAQPPAPTDAQLTQFMTENAAQLTRPEQRVLTIVRFNPAMIPSTGPVTEEALRKRYEFRKDTVAKPETRTLVQIPVRDAAAAAQVAERLRKGEDPAAVAKSLGVDPVRYVDRPKSAIVDKQVAEAAFALPAGAVSGAIAGSLGQSVVKVEAVTPGQAISFEQMRPALEVEVRQEAAAEKAYELSQTYDQAHAGGANLAESAKRAGVPSVTIGPVTRDGRGPDGRPVQGLSPQILAAAFDLPTGGESDLQEAQGESFAVRVERIIPKALPPLAEVRPQLAQAYVLRQLVSAMQTRADALAKRVRAGESLEAVARSAGATVAHVAGVDRANAAQSTALSRDAFGKAFAAKPGEVFTAENTRFGLIVGRLEAVRPPPAAEVAGFIEPARPQMTVRAIEALGELARREARTEMKTKTNPAMARQALGLEPETPALVPAKAKGGA